jgi:thiol-disulfide isomerase/thioredoxin
MAFRFGLLALLLVSLLLSGCTDEKTASSDPPKASINGGTGKKSGEEKIASNADKKGKGINADDDAAAQAAVSFQEQLDEVVAAAKKLPPAELAAGLVNLSKQAGYGKDEADAKVNHLKLHRLVIKLADEIIANKEAGDDAQTSATVAKWKSTHELSIWDEPGAKEGFRNLTQELTKHPNADLARTAKLRLLKLDVETLVDDDSGAEDVARRLVTVLNDKQAGEVEAYFVQEGLFLLESTGRLDLAKQVYEALLSLGGRIGKPEAAEMIQKDYDTAMRRYGWLNKPVELAGTQFNGKPFNLDDYRGKVLLVDFWATWCPPCMKELPNLIETHKQFADAGFEVVGIALDDDRDTLKTFLDDKELPWVTLWSTEKDQQMYDDPRAKQFGVDGIPRTFLVDREGKVVAIGLHGKRLRAKIAELVGAEGGKTREVSKTSGVDDAESRNESTAARLPTLLPAQ